MVIVSPLSTATFSFQMAIRLKHGADPNYLVNYLLSGVIILQVRKKYRSQVVQDFLNEDVLMNSF